MDEQTERTLKSLVGHTIVRVEIRDGDVIELGVPESEGWHVVLSPRISEGVAELEARWEPGLPRPRPTAQLRRLARRLAQRIS